MPTPHFITIDRHHLDAVTGGLTSTLRTRRQAPDVPTPQSNAMEQKMAGLMSALKGVGQPAQQAPAPSPLAGLGSMGGLPMGGMGGMPMG